jgi:hypothetical protein
VSIGLCVKRFGADRGLLVPFLPDTSQKIIDTFASGRIKPIEVVLFPKIYKHSQQKTMKPKIQLIDTHCIFTKKIIQYRQ